MNEVIEAPEPSDLSPRSYAELRDFADMLAASGLVPKDYIGKPDACMVAMQWGHELGLKPLQALQNIAIIGNRPSIWGDAQLALVLSSPACKDVVEYFEGDGEDTVAVCVAQRHGRQDKIQRFSYSDARTAGLIGKDVWQKYPPRMLAMRARGYALRDQFADVLRGLPVAELLREAVDMGMVDEVPPPVRPSAPATPPASGVEGVKANLKKVRPPKLADVLRDIEQAGDAAALKHAGERAGQLLDEGEKAQARKAYHDKLQASRTPKPKAPEQPPVTYAMVADDMREAKDADALNVAADNIRRVLPEEQQAELRDLYSSLMHEFDEAGEQGEA
jgi:hypothetical protein